MYRLLLLLIMLQISLTGFGQKNKLKISGTVYAEKAAAGDVRIIVIEIENQKFDTIEIKKMIPHKSHPVAGEYTIDLSLNKQYKIVFEGDSDFQETRYFEVSTIISDNTEPKNYSINDMMVSIWIGNKIKKEGEIYFDEKNNEFKVLRNQ